MGGEICTDLSKSLRFKFDWQPCIELKLALLKKCGTQALNLEFYGSHRRILRLHESGSGRIRGGRNQQRRRWGFRGGCIVVVVVIGSGRFAESGAGLFPLALCAPEVSLLQSVDFATLFALADSPVTRRFQHGRSTTGHRLRAWRRTYQNVFPRRSLKRNVFWYESDWMDAIRNNFWLTTEGAMVIGVVKEAGPWYWLMRRLDLLPVLPDSDLILLRKPTVAAANKELPGSSWAGRAISKWSAKLKLAIWDAGSV